MKTYQIKDGTLTIHRDGKAEFNNVSGVEVNQFSNRIEINDKDTGQELLCIVFTSGGRYVVC